MEELLHDDLLSMSDDDMDTEAEDENMEEEGGMSDYNDEENN